MLLTEEERRRFVEYCRSQATSTRGIMAEAKKLNMVPALFSVMNQRYEVLARAHEIVAQDLETVEDMSTGSELPKDDASLQPRIAKAVAAELRAMVSSYDSIPSDVTSLEREPACGDLREAIESWIRGRADELDLNGSVDAKDRDRLVAQAVATELRMQADALDVEEHRDEEADEHYNVSASGFARGQEDAADRLRSRADELDPPGLKP